MMSPIGDALSGGRGCGYVLLVSVMSSQVRTGTYDDRRGIISAVPIARQSQLTCLAHPCCGFVQQVYYELMKPVF